ncbi:MAG: hypothetical protein AAFW84_01300 [Cyanobacteria bacterium J06635_15]
MSSKKLYSFRLPIDLVDQLREQADQLNTSVTQIVVQFMEQGLKGGVGDRLKSLEEEIREMKARQLAAIQKNGETPQAYQVRRADHHPPEGFTEGFSEGLPGELSESEPSPAQLKHEVNSIRAELNSLKEILKAR